MVVDEILIGLIVTNTFALPRSIVTQPLGYNQTIHQSIYALFGMTIPLPPKLKNLPSSLPKEGAVRIELSEGIPIFRA